MSRFFQPRLMATLLGLCLLISALMAAQQAAAGEPVGAVTALKGQATVAREPKPEPAALRFRDDVFFRDQITTRERSTVRLLLGGKGTLTIREQSRVTLDESATPEGGRRSVVGLLTGKIGAAIASGLMRPGDVIEFKTPNAVAAVRGTVLIVEYLPPQGSAAAPQPFLLASAAPGAVLAQAPSGAGGTSNFFVVSGQVTITPQGMTPVTLGPLQAVSVVATPTGIQTGTVKTITPAQLSQAVQGLDTGKSHMGEPEASKTAQAQVAAAVLNAIVQATTGTPPPAPPSGPQQPADQTVQDTVAALTGQDQAQATPSGTSPTPTIAPIVPEIPATTENNLPSGPLLALDNVTRGLAPATSLGTFSAGPASTVIRPVPVESTLSAPLLEITGTTITHDGPMMTLDNGTSITGAAGDTTTPLVKIEGTSLTNTGLPLLRLSGNSAVTTSGPLFAQRSGSSVTLSGGPMIQATGGSLTADALVTTDGQHNTSILTGNLLDLLNATVTLRAVTDGPAVSSDTYTYTRATGEPSIRMVNSNLTLSGAGKPLVSVGADAGTPIPQGGVALTASNTSGTTKTISLAGPMLGLHGVNLTDVSAQIQLSNMTVNQSGPNSLIEVAGPPVNVAGPLLHASDGIFSISNSLLSVQGSLTSTSTGSLISLDPTTITAATLISIGPGGSVVLVSPLLSAVDTEVKLSSDAIQVGAGGSLTSTTTAPLVTLAGSSSLQSTTGGFLNVSGTGSTVTLGGPLLVATDSPITTGGDLVLLSGPGASLTSTTVSPLVTLTRSALTAGDTSGIGSFLAMSTTTAPAGTLAFAGPLLVATDSPLTTGSDFLRRSGFTASITSTTPQALVQLTGSPLTTLGNYLSIDTSSLLNLFGSTSLALAGPLLSATNSPLSTGSNFLIVLGANATAGSTGTGAFVQLTQSPLTIGGGFLGVINPSNDRSFGRTTTLALAAPLLLATDSSVTTGGSFLGLFGPEATIRGTGTGAFVQLTQSPLTIGGSFVGIGSPFSLGPSSSTLELAGPLLVATAAEGTTAPLSIGGDFVRITSGHTATLTSTGADPVVQLTRSPVTVGGSFLTMDSQVFGTPGTLTLAGPLLVATNSPMSFGSRFLGLFGPSTSRTGTGTDPLVQLNQSPLTTGDSFLTFDTFGPSSTLALAGPLLNGTDSPLTVAGSLMAISNGGRLTSTTTNPLITLTGGTHSIGSGTAAGSGSLLDLRGVNTDSVTGRGTDLVLQTGGRIIEATGGATLNLPGAGNAVRVDTALVSAGGSLLRVRNGSTLNATTPLSLMQITNSTVNIDGNFFNLGSGPGQPGSTASLAGPLLGASNSALASAPISNFVKMEDGATFTSTTTQSLLTVSGGSITTKSFVTRIGLDPSPLNTPTGSQDPVSATLAGPLLSGTDTSITATSGVLGVRDRATFKSTTTAPLIQLLGTTPCSGGSPCSNTLTLGGPDPDPASPTFGQQVNSRVLDVQPVLTTPFSTSAELAGPLLSATNTTIYTLDRILSVFGQTGASATLTSHTSEPLVQLTGGSVTMSGTFYPPTTSPSGTTTSTSGRFLAMSSPDPTAPATLTLAGPLLRATGTTFEGHNHFIRIGSNAQLSSISTEPLVQLSNVTLSVSGTDTFVPVGGGPPTISTYGDFARVQDPGAGLSLNGPFLANSDSPLALAGSVLQVRNGGTLVSNTSLPLMNFSDTTVQMDGGVFQLRSGLGASGSPATLAGPVLQATNTTFHTGPVAGNFFNIRDGATFTSTTTDSLLQLTGSTITAGHVVRIARTHDGTGSDAPVVATIAGPVLTATDSTITGIWDLHNVGDGTTYRNTGTAPLIQLGGTTGTTVTLGGIDPDPTSLTFGQPSRPSVFGVGHRLNTVPNAPTSVEIAGSILSATNSRITTSGRVIAIYGQTGGASTTVSSATLDPLVQLTGVNLTMAGTFLPAPVGGGTITTTSGNFLDISSPDPGALASLTAAGPLLRANNATILGKNHFLNIGSNVSVTSTGTAAAVQLTNSPLTILGTSTFTPSGGGAPSVSTFGNFLNLCCPVVGPPIAGALLNATDSPLTVAGSLVSAFNGGGIHSTTIDPLIKITGGTHEIGSGTGGGIGSLLDLRGVNTNPGTGLGTNVPLQTGGIVFEVNNAATVNLSGAGNAIRVDTALLAAAAPVVNLINSTLNTSTAGDATNGAMHLFQSSVTSLGPVFGLDNSTLTVKAGPLLTLTGGSNMTVNGDFTSLVNGSKITVLNGPLIRVDGINAAGTASTLNVSGALVNFGGTGGNQVIVNNAIAPTATLSGLPVNVGIGGSSINIGPNPIKNTGLGTVSVNGILAGPGPHTGSLIQATNGGRVTITAP